MCHPELGLRIIFLNQVRLLQIITNMTTSASGVTGFNPACIQTKVSSYVL